MVITAKLPIFDHRQIVGYASSAKQAEKYLRYILQHTVKGWKISVHMRNTDVIDLPAGWVYSIHP